MLKKNYKIALLLCSPFLLTTKVFADDPPTLDPDTIDKIISAITDRLVPFAGLLAFIFVVYGGYMWIISSGDPDKVKRAQGTLQWAIIGLVFTIIAGLIIRAILEAIQ